MMVALMLRFVRMPVSVRMIVGRGSSAVHQRVGVAAVHQHARLASGDAAAVRDLKDQLGAQAESGGGLLQQIGRDAGVNQRAQQHVSADAGKTFEIANAHVFSLMQREAICCR